LRSPQNPATHRLAAPVVRIDTHAGAIFLAGPDVYKVKRAVRFPFMNLSTLDKRRAAREAEVVVNRKYAYERRSSTLQPRASASFSSCSNVGAAKPVSRSINSS
jgi:hypothetical protein